MEDMIQGKWMQIRGEAKKLWGQLTDDELLEVNGDFEKLAGKIQEKYGYTLEKARQEVDRFRTEMDRKYTK